MNAHRFGQLISRAWWRAAVLGLLAAGFGLLPAPAAAQVQPFDTVIVLSGTGSTQTSRVQVGSQCFPGQTPPKVIVVVTEIAGGPSATILGLASCGGVTQGLSSCTNPAGMSSQCPGAGVQLVGALADCSAIYLGPNVPTVTWKVTCIFRR
jgi:hypothetical protein